MTDYMVTGLIRRRAELAGKVEALHSELSQTLRDLDAIDRAIMVIDPNVQIEAIRPKAFRPPADWSKKGQMARMVLNILRQAVEPLTTREIALQMLVERAMDAEDRKLLNLMTKRVATSLRYQRDQGRALSQDGPGPYALWELAR